MQENLQVLVSQAKDQIANSESLEALNTIRVEYLGKKGKLTAVLKNVGQLPKEERPKLGQAVNAAKDQVQVYLEEQHAKLHLAAMEQRLSSEALDVHLDGRGESAGRAHPISSTIARISELFKAIGFEVKQGPQIENEYYNFEALNTPESHPG